MKPIVLSGARVVDPGRNVDQVLDVLIEGERISAVEKPGSFKAVADAETIDLSGKVVTPGFIDLHVHLRDPGFEYKETIESGATAAVAGGYTSICCMPNTNPVNDNASVTKNILEKAKAAAKARVLPIGAITKGSKGEELAPMLELFDAGCVAFSDDGLPVMNAAVMRRALDYGLMLNAVISCHEEDLHLTKGWSMNEGVMATKLGLIGFPSAAEEIMIARDIELARYTGGRVHFCHVTTARGALLIERAKEDGIAVTAEVTPHHITLSEEAVDGFNTSCKMSPPLRTEKDVEAVLDALKRGVLDCIASDHAPHEHDSKAQAFVDASNGMIGLQTNLCLTLRQVAEGKISLNRALAALSYSPAKCFGLTPNHIAKGSLADISVVDLEQEFELRPEDICSKSKNTPFIGWKFKGCNVMTFVGGRKVYERRGQQ